MRLSEYQKILLIKLEDKYSYQLLAEKIGANKSTCYKFLQKFHKFKTIQNLPGRGRKLKLRPRSIKKIKTYISKFPFSTRKEMINKLDLKIHPNSLSRYLYELGFKSRVAATKTRITSLNMNKRNTFAETVSRWTINKWKSCIFSDESSVEIGKKYSSKLWRKRGDRYKEINIDKRRRIFVKKYVKVFSYITYNGPGILTVLDGKWNSKKYTKLLSEVLVPDCNRLLNNRNYWIIEDGDTSKTSRYSVNFKREKAIKSVTLPPNSGDINCVENCWWLLKKELSKLNIHTKEELIDTLPELWKKTITTDICRKLILSMPRRIASLIKVKGAYIKY